MCECLDFSSRSTDVLDLHSTQIKISSPVKTIYRSQRPVKPRINIMTPHSGAPETDAELEALSQREYGKASGVWEAEDKRVT